MVVTIPGDGQHANWKRRSGEQAEMDEALFRIKADIEDLNREGGPVQEALEGMDASREKLKAEVEKAKVRNEKEALRLRELLIKTVEALKEKRRRQLEVLDQHLKDYQDEAEVRIQKVKSQTRELKKLSSLLPVPEPKLKKSSKRDLPGNKDS